MTKRKITRRLSVAKNTFLIDPDVARVQLRMIAKKIDAGIEVLCGDTRLAAAARFVAPSLTNEADHIPLKQVELTSLSKHWTYHLKCVVSASDRLMVMNRGAPCMILIPSIARLKVLELEEKRIAAREEKAAARVLLPLVRKLAAQLDDLIERLPSEQDIRKWNRTLALSDQILKEWRSRSARSDAPADLISDRA